MQTMTTVKILISQAIPGMVVAADVYTKDDHLILSRDTTLTDKMITRLVFYSITELSVFSYAEDADVEFASEYSTYYEKIRESESFKRFHLAYQNTVNEFKKSLDQMVTGTKDINIDEMLNETSKLLNNCSSNIELFNMLHCMRNYDDTTYVHSLNVALICNIIGKWLKFNRKDLETITLAGLLHDIGKLMIPSNIITKPSKLTDEEFLTIKTHPLRGYNLLKSKEFDPRIKRAALMHHERCDGSGYPYGFYSDQIDSFAKLVSIADVYDAMTCARVYRGPLCPFNVIHIFETEGYAKYDSKYIMTFLEGIVQTYIHSSVILNNGQTGEIIFINRRELSRPIIRIEDAFIDLTRHRDLQIVSLI